MTMLATAIGWVVIGLVGFVLALLVLSALLDSMAPRYDERDR